MKKTMESMEQAWNKHGTSREQEWNKHGTSMEEACRIPGDTGKDGEAVFGGRRIHTNTDYMILLQCLGGEARGWVRREAANRIEPGRASAMALAQPSSRALLRVGEMGSQHCLGDAGGEEGRGKSNPGGRRGTMDISLKGTRNKSQHSVALVSSTCTAL